MVTGDILFDDNVPNIFESGSVSEYTEPLITAQTACLGREPPILIYQADITQRNKVDHFIIIMRLT